MHVTAPSRAAARRLPTIILNAVVLAEGQAHQQAHVHPAKAIPVNQLLLHNMCSIRPYAHATITKTAQIQLTQTIPTPTHHSAQRMSIFSYGVIQQLSQFRIHATRKHQASAPPARWVAVSACRTSSSCQAAVQGDHASCWPSKLILPSQHPSARKYSAVQSLWRLHCN